MKIDYDFILRSNPLTHNQNLPDSYYAKTANYQPEYPNLQENITTDVCIIGGGFSGINTAIELRERGYSVVVLEARKIAWGASGRNGGQLLRGIGQNNHKFKHIIGQEGIDTLEKMGDEAIEIVKKRISQYNISCDLKLGSTMVALKPQHVEQMKTYAEHLYSINYPHTVTLTSEKDISQIIDSKKYIGALTLGGDAHLHPLNLCLGEAQAASNLGVHIYQNSPVSEIKEGANIVVKTNNACEVTAKFTVLCANAYIRNMHPKLTSKVLPAGSYIIATEPLKSERAEKLLPLDSAIVDLNYALDYYRLSADKRLLFGGLCNYSALDPSSIEASLSPKMLSVFPQLKDVNIDYQWGGMIGVGMNRLPQIGRIGHNLYYAQGYAGHGVNATHIAARLIAESISQQSNRIDLFEKIKHYTFPGGKRLQSALFALGMSYFKLKDYL